MLFPTRIKKITVDFFSKVLKIDCIDCSVISGPPGISIYLSVFRRDETFSLSIYLSIYLSIQSQHKVMYVKKSENIAVMKLASL